MEQIPRKRLVLLWEIAMETDWNDSNLLEERIYRYGSFLGAGDRLGRLVFVRMAQLLRKISNTEKQSRIQTE